MVKYFHKEEEMAGTEKKETEMKGKQIVKKEKSVPACKDTGNRLPVETEKPGPAAEGGTVIEVSVPVSSAIPKAKNKKKQVRYVFRDVEKGWFEKERDNARVTKYYATQKEAVEAAKEHIRNSGMPGSIIIQSKMGRIRANTKVTTKKL